MRIAYCGKGLLPQACITSLEFRLFMISVSLLNTGGDSFTFRNPMKWYVLQIVVMALAANVFA
ncbi:MAG: hypothetical protein KJN98_07340, partial [Pontiella sp.]|nr:hypothetical protein [Pontiella sp.]